MHLRRHRGPAVPLCNAIGLARISKTTETLDYIQVSHSFRFGTGLGKTPHYPNHSIGLLQ